MSLLLNKDKFADMENAFTRLKANESDAAALRQLSDALHSITGKTIIVNTVRPESKNQECTVMSVYPEESVLDALVDAIITEQNNAMIVKIWNDTTKWIIEIDTRILGPDAGMTEQELTALTLHEVGHVIYSNSIPMRISKIIRYEFVKTSVVNKELLKDTFFNKLLYIPLLNAMGKDRSKESMKNEYRADKYAMQAGYGKYLASAIDKVMIFAGTKTNNNDETKELYGFSVDTLIQLQQRQNNIVRKNMGIMLASTPSRFVKGAIQKLSKSISGKESGGSIKESSYDDFISERIDDITNHVYESIFSGKRLKRIDPAEIDYIGIEIENIRSNDDKMMIISYIYSKLDTIDYYIALIDSGNPKYIIPHTREQLVSMRNLLEEYRKAAMTRKLPDINYGISINWPEGYEG